MQNFDNFRSEEFDPNQFLNKFRELLAGNYFMFWNANFYLSSYF